MRDVNVVAFGLRLEAGRAVGAYPVAELGLDALERANLVGSAVVVAVIIGVDRITNLRGEDL